MASHAELAYTGIVDSLAALGREFELRVAPQPPVPAPAVSR